MDEAVIAPHLFAVHVQRGVESLHLTGDAGFLIAGIEVGDRTAARGALAQRFPGRGGVVANGRDQSDASHHDASGHSSVTSPQVHARPPLVPFSDGAGRTSVSLRQSGHAARPEYTLL